MQSKDLGGEGKGDEERNIRGIGLRLEKESEGGAMRMMDIRCKSLMKEKDFEATS